MTKIKQLLLIKTATYRILSVLTTGLVSYTLTSSFAIAGKIVTVDTFIKVGLYYYHECLYATAIQKRKKRKGKKKRSNK